LKPSHEYVMSGAPSSLQVAVTDRVALVKFSGRATFNSSVDFKTLVYQLYERGVHSFILDLTECVTMDSTFLGVLAGFGLKLNEFSGKKAVVTLLNPNQHILDLLENLGVAGLFGLAHGTNALSENCEEVRPDDSPNRTDTTRICLEAHQVLMGVNSANASKFKEVARFLAEDLKRQESRKP
jgi:anti-sigma B factor antagonist